MVKLRIKKDLEWGEYIVQWIEDGKLSEDKSYYAGGIDTDHALDAVYSAVDMIERARGNGVAIEFNADQKTTNLVSKFRPDFLLAETRRILHERGIV